MRRFTVAFKLNYLCSYCWLEIAARSRIQNITKSKIIFNTCVVVVYDLQLRQLVSEAIGFKMHFFKLNLCRERRFTYEKNMIVYLLLNSNFNGSNILRLQTVISFRNSRFCLMCFSNSPEYSCSFFHSNLLIVIGLYFRSHSTKYNLLFNIHICM